MGVINPIKEKKLYYLASPYSHPDPYMIELRYAAVVKAGYELKTRGYNLIEPIAQSHHQAKTYNMPGEYYYWQDRDRLMVDRSDGLLVLTIPGWKESPGVADEMGYAASRGKPVMYIDPESYEIKDSPNGSSTKEDW